MTSEPSDKSPFPIPPRHLQRGLAVGVAGFDVSVTLGEEGESYRADVAFGGAVGGGSGARGVHVVAVGEETGHGLVDPLMGEVVKPGAVARDAAVDRDAVVQQQFGGVIRGAAVALEAQVMM